MAHHTITASELKFAVLYPEWRLSWLAGQKPSTRTFAPPGTLPALSVQFHKEAQNLARWLTSQENLAAAAKIASSEALIDHLWATSLQAFTDELFANGKGEEAAVFTERMGNFCAHLIDLKSKTARFENWQDVFIATEENLARIPVQAGDKIVEVRARVDAIRIHPEHHLEVVDYKLSQGREQKADLVQLAIYAHLLTIWRPGCKFCGTLEYYLPEFSEVRVSQTDLADIYSGMVAPVLLEMFAPEATGKLIQTQTDVLVEPSQNPFGDAIVDAFRSFNLGVEIASVVEGPQLVRVRLKPSPGVKVSSLANRAADVQVRLSLTEPPLIKPGKGFVLLDLPRPERKPCFLKEALKGALAGTFPGAVSFPIGIGIEGEVIVADFADPGTCHALVAGSTGSGKSEWLKALVASILLRNTPSNVQIGLIDPKILTFAGVEGSAFLWRPVATTFVDAMTILRDAVEEMDRRYTILQSGGFVNLSERLKSGKSDIPFLLLIFDEFADLVLGGGGDKKEFETLVARIAGKGRAAGIHLVLATQRPDRTIVTGLIKANLPLKICLKVATSVNAQIVLDEPGAESLFGKGDLLCDFGKGLVRAQGLFIPQPEFLDALKNKPAR